MSAAEANRRSRRARGLFSVAAGDGFRIYLRLEINGVTSPRRVTLLFQLKPSPFGLRGGLLNSAEQTVLIRLLGGHERAREALGDRGEEAF